MRKPMGRKSGSPRLAGPTLPVRTALAALATLALTSGPAQAADLVATFRDAATNDATYESARDAYLAGQEKLPQGLAGLLPQVGLTATESPWSGTTIVQPPFPTFNITYPSRGFALTLTQPLFRWSNFEQYEQSKVMVALAAAQFAQAGQDLILRLATAYFNVLGAEDNVSVLKSQKAAIAEQLAAAKRNFEVGTSTITDANEAQARYDLVVAQEIAAQSDLEVKRSALQQIIGTAPGHLAALRPGANLSAPDPATIESWVTASEQNNPAVVQAQATLEIAQRQIAINQSGHLPTLDLQLQRQFQRSPQTAILPPELGSTATNSIGIQLSVPIYSGGLVSSKVREAVALRDKAQSDLEVARRAAAQNARQAYVGVTSGLAQVHALEAAQRSSQTALESNQMGYQVGVRINIDVLNAQQQLYSTERDLAQARYGTLLSSLQLKAAAGNLVEEDLAAINQLLEH